MPARHPGRLRPACLAALAGLTLACGELDRGQPARGKPAASASTPTWSADVAPLLDAHCGVCHRSGGAGAAASAYALSGDRDADYATVTALIQVDDPPASRLLVKARGEGGHAGGTVLAADSTEYARLLAWVTAGAP